VARTTAAALRLGMLNEGVDLIDYGMMVSSAHTQEDAARAVEALRTTLRAMKAEGAI
jgi:glutamate-1-semialdehyde aminotransferase